MSDFFWSNPILQPNADWSSAYIDSLSDDSFLVIYKGGRHLPVKNHLGKYDCAHIRNAISRAPQTTSIPPHLRKKAQAKARALLKRYCG
jgi:hypothetical protein